MPRYYERLFMDKERFQFQRNEEIPETSDIFLILEEFLRVDTLGPHVAIVCSDEADHDLQWERLRDELKTHHNATYEEISLIENNVNCTTIRHYGGVYESSDIVDTIDNALRCMKWVHSESIDFNKTADPIVERWKKRQQFNRPICNSKEDACDLSEEIAASFEQSNKDIFIIFRIPRSCFTTFIDPGMYFPSFLNYVVMGVSPENEIQSMKKQIQEMQEQLDAKEKQLIRKDGDIRELQNQITSLRAAFQTVKKAYEQELNAKAVLQAEYSRCQEENQRWKQLYFKLAKGKEKSQKQPTSLLVESENISEECIILETECVNTENKNTRALERAGDVAVAYPIKPNSPNSELNQGTVKVIESDMIADPVDNQIQQEKTDSFAVENENKPVPKKDEERQ